MSTDMIHTLQQEADEYVRPFANNVLCVCFFIIGALASLYAALAVFEVAQLVLFVVSFFAWVFIIPFLDLALSAVIAGAVAAGGIYLSYKLAQGLDYLLKHIGGRLMGLVSIGCAVASVWMQFTLPIQLELWQEELLGLLIVGVFVSLFFTRFALYPLFLLLVLIVNLLFYLVFYKSIEPYIPPEKRLPYTQEQPVLEESALDEDARLNAYSATLVPVSAQMYQEAYTPSATTLQPTEARFRIFGKPPKGTAKGARPLPKTKAVTSRLLVWGKKVLPSMKKGLRAFSRSGVVARPAKALRVARHDAKARRVTANTTGPNAVKAGDSWRANKGNPLRSTSEKSLNDHYAKHGKRVGDVSSADAYHNAAKRFLNSPPRGTLTRIREYNGDVVRYNPKTKLYGVISKHGEIQTFFKVGPRSTKNPYGYKAENYASPKEYFYGIRRQ
ncbi:MAG: hypothetical protein VX730_03355 [Pseudomonadota bacterium]|nr:hypothetical protein [Pseudomonadota bacterium]